MNYSLVADVDELRSDKQSAFVREYVKDWNATQAAIRAGYSEATAASIGYENLRKPEIRAAVERRIATIAAAAEVDAALVISELATVALADPREIMRVEVDCCRYCHGLDCCSHCHSADVVQMFESLGLKDCLRVPNPECTACHGLGVHKYQWTPAEHDRATRKAQRDGTPAPELAGGIGYNAKRPPAEDCPECFGRGLERVVVTDSRKLSKATAKLMASVKQGKDGIIEGKTRDQDAALIALGRVVGVFKDRQEVSGPNGGPLQLQPVRPARELTNAELEEILRASGRLQGPITEEKLDKIIKCAKN